MNKKVTIDDLKKSKLMWVWDDNKCDKITKDVVYIFTGGVIDSNGDEWVYYEEIPEPTYRPYTAKELPTLLGKILRWKSNTDIVYLITTVDVKELNVVVQYKNDYKYTTENILRNCEILTDGEWQIAGVLE